MSGKGKRDKSSMYAEMRVSSAFLLKKARLLAMRLTIECCQETIISILALLRSDILSVIDLCSRLPE